MVCVCVCVCVCVLQTRCSGCKKVRLRCSCAGADGPVPRGAGGWRVGEAVEVEKDGLYYICRVSKVDVLNKRYLCALAHAFAACLCIVFACACARQF